MITNETHLCFFVSMGIHGKTPLLKQNPPDVKTELTTRNLQVLVVLHNTSPSTLLQILTTIVAIERFHCKLPASPKEQYQSWQYLKWGTMPPKPTSTTSFHRNFWFQQIVAFHNANLDAHFSCAVNALCSKM